MRDPIWKYLYVDIVWKILYSILILVRKDYANIAAYASLIASAFWLAFAIWHFMFNRSFWRRIGEKRKKAVHVEGDQQLHIDAWSAMQVEPLPTPTAIITHWHNAGVVTLAALIGMAFLLTCASLFEISRSNFHGLLNLLVYPATLFALCVFTFYTPQRIEITEEGITTYYKREKRHLNWNEIRSFVRYTWPRFWKGYFDRKLYEVSDGHTIVRWSPETFVLQQTKCYLANGQVLNEDANSRLLQTIAARTGLPLLNFDTPVRLLPETEESR
uniref:Uncharacterized protein n=1 Tax=Thermosporothrix sp. COM3 TaxID=2490863 RepID=A0A455SIR7_9CHLR|nr:hypothetical protein KTC_15730 [Thermosporothrix sp. COM3]